MPTYLLILLIGLLYLFGFGALSLGRQQGLSLRFAVEGLAVTAVGTALTYVSVPLHPLLFLVLLYAITMRVRLLVDLGNWFTARKQYRRAGRVHSFALRLRPDTVSRQIVLINLGVSQLGLQDPQAAYQTLTEALHGEEERVGAKYVAAGYYNLGLACRRTGREAEAIRRFNQAMDTLPNSIYARAAERALREGCSPRD
jgi:tetratricopeptide (TPR) repeat protein